MNFAAPEYVWNPRGTPANRGVHRQPFFRAETMCTTCLGYRQFAFLLPFLLCMIGILGCTSSAPSPSNTPASSTAENVVTVGEPVLCSILQELVGNDIQFLCPDVPAGAAVSTAQIQQIQSSKIIVLDGTHASNQWSQQVSLPQSRTIHSTFEILDRLIFVSNLSTHSHGPGTEHSHGGTVSQTWLDPALFGQQIEYVLSTLAEKELISNPDYLAKVEQWQQMTADLNQRLDQHASPTPRPVLVDHVGTEYLCRRLNWQPEVFDFSRTGTQQEEESRVKLNEWLKEHPTGLLISTSDKVPPLSGLEEPTEGKLVRLNIDTKAFISPQYIISFEEILKKLP